MAALVFLRTSAHPSAGERGVTPQNWDHAMGKRVARARHRRHSVSGWTGEGNRAGPPMGRAGRLCDHADRGRSQGRATARARLTRERTGPVIRGEGVSGGAAGGGGTGGTGRGATRGGGGGGGAGGSGCCGAWANGMGLSGLGRVGTGRSTSASKIGTMISSPCESHPANWPRPRSMREAGEGR